MLLQRWWRGGAAAPTPQPDTGGGPRAVTKHLLQIRIGEGCLAVASQTLRERLSSDVRRGFKEPLKRRGVTGPSPLPAITCRESSSGGQPDGVRELVLVLQRVARSNRSHADITVSSLAMEILKSIGC
ncbi:hypothetical protein AAFF_G00402780 [Aldrovandia affinis]|uniref:Uncharacterized protein n=1 Tax=Aldrovandia affinis TaxID=143900 RepID=A0AAD7WZQ7_9TELE|nr:hypothetical protein AAFF_G00402780 [Aldrovandia affinis]